MTRTSRSLFITTLMLCMLGSGCSLPASSSGNFSYGGGPAQGGAPTSNMNINPDFNMNSGF